VSPLNKERLEVLRKLDDLTEQHCTNCEKRREIMRRLPGHFAKIDSYCSNECPVGFELRQLGEKLNASVRERKEQKAMSVQIEPSKTKFLTLIAEGKTISAAEKGMGYSKNAIYPWLKKWELTGIKPDKARELLGMGPVVEEEPAVLREKDVAGLEQLNLRRKLADTEAAVVHWKELAERSDAEIARLNEQLKEAAEAANRNSDVAARFDTELVKAKDEARKEIARLNEALKGAAVIADQAEARIKELELKVERQEAYETAELSDLREENDRLQNELEQQTKFSAEALEKINSLQTQLAAATGYAEGVPSDPNSTYQALVQFGAIKPVSDSINHPRHYTAGKVECIDAIEAATAGLTGFEGMLTGNSIKYLWRWKRKNGVEDLNKAKWYIDRLIGEVEQG
jgi:transposase